MDVFFTIKLTNSSNYEKFKSEISDNIKFPKCDIEFNYDESIQKEGIVELTVELNDHEDGDMMASLDYLAGDRSDGVVKMKEIASQCNLKIATGRAAKPEEEVEYEGLLEKAFSEKHVFPIEKKPTVVAVLSFQREAFEEKGGQIRAIEEGKELVIQIKPSEDNSENQSLSRALSAIKNNIKNQGPQR